MHTRVYTNVHMCVYTEAHAHKETCANSLPHTYTHICPWASPLPSAAPSSQSVHLLDSSSRRNAACAPASTCHGLSQQQWPLVATKIGCFPAPGAGTMSLLKLLPQLLSTHTCVYSLALVLARVSYRHLITHIGVYGMWTVHQTLPVQGQTGPGRLSSRRQSCQAGTGGTQAVRGVPSPAP